jgi:hypothetical protein
MKITPEEFDRLTARGQPFIVRGSIGNKSKAIMIFEFYFELFEMFFRQRMCCYFYCFVTAKKYTKNRCLKFFIFNIHNNVNHYLLDWSCEYLMQEFPNVTVNPQPYDVDLEFNRTSR